MLYKNVAKNTAVTAVMAALLIIGKFVLAAVPNVEIVTPFIIVFTCVFGFKRAIFSVLIFCVWDNFLYGFNPLVALQYFFHWPLLCLFSALLYKFFGARLLPFLLLGIFSALLFWVETPVIYAIFKFQPFMPSLIAGFSFMLPMLVSAVVTILFCFIPLYNLLYKIKEKCFRAEE